MLYHCINAIPSPRGFVVREDACRRRYALPKLPHAYSLPQGKETLFEVLVHNMGKADLPVVCTDLYVHIVGFYAYLFHSYSTLMFDAKFL